MVDLDPYLKKVKLKNNKEDLKSLKLYKIESFNTWFTRRGTQAVKFDLKKFFQVLSSL